MRWELMDRYLAGECDPTELREVERWLAEAPSRRRFLEQLAGPGEAELGEAKARSARERGRRPGTYDRRGKSDRDTPALRKIAEDRDR